MEPARPPVPLATSPTPPIAAALPASLPAKLAAPAQPVSVVTVDISMEIIARSNATQLPISALLSSVPSVLLLASPATQPLPVSAVSFPTSTSM